MDATVEGIGGRKWSYQEKPGEGGMERVLSQGALEIAVLREPHGREVQSLLVTAPQLWQAANDLVLIIARGQEAMGTKEAAALADMVAKAVGKQDWKQVLQ